MSAIPHCTPYPNPLPALSHEGHYAQVADDCLTSAGLRRRLLSVDFHQDCDGQHPLAVFVPDLNRDLAAVTLRQAVPPNLGRSGRGLKAVELKGRVIRGDLVPSRT
jgi:hypothetical protein